MLLSPVSGRPVELYTNLSYCYIRAPFDGAVTRASYDIGNYINGAVQPVTLATLYKDDLMFANFNIEDNQFMKMMLEAARNDSTVKLPTEILVSIGKDGGNAYTGRLDYLSPNIDLSTGTLNVRANLDNPKHVLKSGLYVTITLPYAEQPNAVLHPLGIAGIPVPKQSSPSVVPSQWT